ncbi:stage 0 sporulation family protein [Chloroflexota bacterium]
MADIVGIRFKRACKVYYFDPTGIDDLEVNDYVVVNTARGQELGVVVITPRQVLVNELHEPLKPIVRKAKAEDIQNAKEFEDKEKEALIECGKRIDSLQLPMKLLSADYNLDGNRLTFLFSAGERVDFRELVRQLTSHFKIRVELRQVGPRDEAKLIGGFGRCGCPLCCMNFLSEFAPVSIRMAKEQDLPLNPMRISGVCGRLLCCLVYESEQYHTMIGKLPKVGQRVSSPMGEATIVGSNPLKETVLLELDSQARIELPLSEITIEAKHTRKQGSKSKD